LNPDKKVIDPVIAHLLVPIRDNLRQSLTKIEGA